MNNKKGINTMKVVATGAVLAAGTYAAVKLAKKENRDKVKKLINKYTKKGADFARRVVDMADEVTDKAQDIKKIIKEESSDIKRQIKKV